MTEFSVGDRVLVPGVVLSINQYDVARFRTGTGGEMWVPLDLLRPDTGGRDLTAQDVRTAPAENGAAGVADHLNRIARGDAGSAGDDTAPPAAEPKAWVTREQDCHDLSCLFAASTHTHNDPRAVAGPRAGDTAPDDERAQDRRERELEAFLATREVSDAWGPTGDTAPDDEGDDDSTPMGRLRLFVADADREGVSDRSRAWIVGKDLSVLMADLRAVAAAGPRVDDTAPDDDEAHLRHGHALEWDGLPECCGRAIHRKLDELDDLRRAGGRRPAGPRAGDTAPACTCETICYADDCPACAVLDPELPCPNVDVDGDNYQAIARARV